MRQPSGTTFIALGQAQTLLQGLEATPAGALMRPREGDFTHIRGLQPSVHPYSLDHPPRKGERELYCSMQTKITKGYRREAIERYKHVATYVAIFPVLGRSE